MTENDLDLDAIQLKVEANNWEEALTLASKPLISKGRITEDYVKEMIQSVKKLGPYIVIAPGLALGHARPSSSVIKSSFAIASLENPVKFGSKENDPVDLVVILASTDSESHLSLLQKIVTYLGEEKNLQQLRSAKTREEAKEIVDKINNK